MKRYATIYLLGLFIFFNLYAQTSIQNEVPAVYSNIKYDSDGKLYVDLDSLKVYSVNKPARYTLENMIGDLRGTETGITIDFGKPDFNGKLYYGLIHYRDSKHPLPVYRSVALIDSGKSNLNIKVRLSGIYDMTGWKKSGKGTIGYRVINDKGDLIYDGIISFKGIGPFEIDNTILEGPFVDLITHDSAVISYETNTNIITQVEINGRIYSDELKSTHHELKITNLQPETEYVYSVKYGDNIQSYSFNTAQKKKKKKAFNFAYASDSRA